MVNVNNRNSEIKIHLGFMFLPIPVQSVGFLDELAISQLIAYHKRSHSKEAECFLPILAVQHRDLDSIAFPL